MISATAIANAPGFSAYAEAAGIEMGAQTIGSPLERQPVISSFSSTVTNYGAVSGTAVAGLLYNATNNTSTTTANNANAKGYGINLHAGTFFGGVSNIGTLASITGMAGAYATSSAYAGAAGVSIKADSLYGSVYNEGSIDGYAVASAVGGWDPEATA